MELQEQVDAILAQQGAAAIEDDLLTSEVVEYVGLEGEESGVNNTYRVRLDSGTVAFHKPFSGVAGTCWDYGHDEDQVPINECASWRLAAALGRPLDGLVAVTVLRTVGYEPGSLAVERIDAGDLRDGMVEAPDQLDAAAFFDSLSAQQDRHGGNAVWDAGEGQLGLIDHGYSFAESGAYNNCSLFVCERYGEGRQQLRDWERQALRRLLASADLLGLASILLPSRADALRRRAAEIASRGVILPEGSY